MGAAEEDRLEEAQRDRSKERGDDVGEEERRRDPRERRSDKSRGKKRKADRRDSEDEEPSARQRNAGLDLYRSEPEDPAPPEPKRSKKHKAKKKKEKEHEKETDREKGKSEHQALGSKDRGPGWAKVDRTTASWLLRLAWGKERYERGVYCYLCHEWCTRAHLESKDHKRRISNSGPRPQQATGPPVLHDLPGRLLSEVIDEFSEGESTWIEEEDEDKEQEPGEEAQRERKAKKKKKRDTASPHDEDPPAQRGGAHPSLETEKRYAEMSTPKEAAPPILKEEGKLKDDPEVPKELAKTQDKVRAVSRLEGSHQGGNRLHQADCGCLCQCALESYMEQSISYGGLVASCDTCESDAREHDPHNCLREELERWDTKVPPHAGPSFSDCIGGTHLPREELHGEPIMRAEAQVQETPRWMNDLLGSVQQIREMSRAPPQLRDRGRKPEARGEEEAQGAAPAAVGEQPPGLGEEMPPEPEDETPSLEDFRREEREQEGEQEGVVVIPDDDDDDDDDDPPGGLLYPPTNQSAPAGRKSYGIGFGLLMSELPRERTRVGRRGASTFHLFFQGATLEGWKCLDNVSCKVEEIRAWRFAFASPYRGGLRVGSFNTGVLPSKMGELANLEWDVIAVQELSVSPSSVNSFRKQLHRLGISAVFSELREEDLVPGQPWRAKNGTGVALLARRPWSVHPVDYLIPHEGGAE